MDKSVPANLDGVPAVCAHCEARNGGMCGVPNSEELLFLSKQSVRARVPANSEIAAADEVVSRYSNIIKGVVKLTKLMPDGRQQIVGLQFAPDLIGRPFETHSQVTAEAANDVQLCSFSKRALDQLVRQSQELEHKLHMQALADLDAARDTMLWLGRKSATEKVASFILLLIRHADPIEQPDGDQTDGAGAQIHLPLRRTDIADYLGLTIETVSRQLTKLRKAGVINMVDNRHISIDNVERLASMSGDAIRA
ncbi:MAG: helix-turn-helix domain-containing protein [Pseudomonadota bacterium]